jgi:hypothetical protein
VLKAIRSGRIQRRPDGKIDSDLADLDWVANTNPDKPKNSVTGEPKRRRAADEPSAPIFSHKSNGSGRITGGYAAARAIRESFEARLKQLEFEVRQGKLVNAEEVRHAAFNCARRTRDLLLAIPDRLGAMLAAESDVKECRRILTEEITRVCEELGHVTGR